MKPLSTTRKATVSGAFVIGVVSFAHGFNKGIDLALRQGKYPLLGFLVLFTLLILPYWGNDLMMGSEVGN